jgi:predicted dehydrogenase
MSLTRRAALGLAVNAASYSRILGANERVGVGFIGYGLIGAQHVFDFKNQDDVNLMAVCDSYEPRMEQGVAVCRQKPGQSTRAIADFRRLLEERDIDAVVVSTPDHWHALMTMMACAAGKDVYVEKPMTLFYREGVWMTQVARKHKRIVQVGTQQRSGKQYQMGRALIQTGYIGKVFSARMGSFRNVMPGFGKPEGAQPDNFDYDMWLGPAPKRVYQPHRGLYHFRWFWDYSGGQMTNLAAHELDIFQWYLGHQAPLAVSASGGRFVLEDDGETPDTIDALFEYPGSTALWSHREGGGQARQHGRGIEFYGPKGMLNVNRAKLEVFPDTKVNPELAIPTFQGHPSGGPQQVKTEPELWAKPLQVAGSSAEQFDLHVRNFLDCVKSRQRPIADVEDGHFTATACHLANISYRTGRKIRWDAAQQQIMGDPEANAMLERPYRQPWERVRKGLLA